MKPMSGRSVQTATLIILQACSRAKRSA
jgi:hypothetical protein